MYLRSHGGFGAADSRIKRKGSGGRRERERERAKSREYERMEEGQKYRVFRDFLTQIISTISAKNGAHRGESPSHEKTRDRNCFAVPCNLQGGRSHHVSFAEIINSLFHNYCNVFAKTSMISSVGIQIHRPKPHPWRFYRACSDQAFGSSKSVRKNFSTLDRGSLSFSPFASFHRNDRLRG